uniref:Uncharacterized protein n=1 Tax=Kalanchoe fedtschenkoi TaxID=63787 RepID=A0A7N0RH06_KALFE
MISCAASSHPYLFFHYACNPASDFHKQFQNSTAQKSLPSSFQLVRDLGIFIGLNLPQPVPFNAQGFTFLMIIKALAGSVISMIRGEAPRLGLVIRICQLPGMRWIKRTSLAMATCLFALVGAAVGFVAGGVTGSATESGVARGCGLGVVSGVVVALELFDSLLDGRFISKVVMFGTSLVNGKVFAEWVCPAMLKAFQSQTYIMSVPGHEDSDLYNLDDGPEGLAPHLIDKLPTFRAQPCHDFRCTICLEASNMLYIFY